MSEDKDVWRAIGRAVGVQPDRGMGTLAVRVLRDVVRAIGLDMEHTKVADIAPAVAALRTRVAELEAQNAATAESIRATLADHNAAAARAEQAEAELADVRKALKAPDWYDLTAWAELMKPGSESQALLAAGGAPLACVVCGGVVDYDEAVHAGGNPEPETGECPAGAGPAHRSCRDPEVAR